MLTSPGFSFKKANLYIVLAQNIRNKMYFSQCGHFNVTVLLGVTSNEPLDNWQILGPLSL